MDLMTVIGLSVGLGALYYVLALGNSLGFIYNPEAFILVFGGTVGATLMTYPWSIVKSAPYAFLLIFFPSKRYRSKNIIERIVRLSEKAKRDGIDSLQNELGNLGDKFLEDGIQMIIDGLDEDIVRENLEKEIVFTRKRHGQVSGFFRTMGTYSPIFGLLGTLLGLVQVLRNISTPAMMGQYMAVAVTATFYGIFGTNFLFLPVAGKLNVYSEEEILNKEVMIEGILSIKKGDIPTIVSRKLQAFLSYKLRSR
ncbi:MAG: MotA/TolQ/ExbB proton channel family protein [Elusimicrobiota bacterium]